MKSVELRQKFIDFFTSKDHTFIPSSPIVVKDDPTLLFVNAGMNQFKEFFLGEKAVKIPRVVNSQKCLRVSGKHNDLEEVGHDTYHHTMFEMLGNWSFGNYFKRKAINLAWDFLTQELAISPDRLFITFFAGDNTEKLQKDSETYAIWSEIIEKDKIVEGVKKDNFWEMGAVGPCGPSTEIHIDLRSDSDRDKISTKDLINKDHPQVIEIWNIVFIEFNRKENGLLDVLPQKHVDTGMGFERLCMVLQNKTSTYDTDIFYSLISEISSISQIAYNHNETTDIAIRVIVDHIRAIGFSIADGQLPSSNGAGYVVRRILRRAVRYGYTYLNLKEPFLFKLTLVLCQHFNNIFPELYEQKSLIESVIKQEESMFLKTLGKGLDLINNTILLLDNNVNSIAGIKVFELYDTYGFPPDLTALILKEKGLTYSQAEFDKEMDKQKARSRSASELQLGDWIEVNSVPVTGFLYDDIICESLLVKYRQVKMKDQIRYHMVFDKTPFYPEGGGQVGDSGSLKFLHLDQAFNVIDTKKENNVIIHIVENLHIVMDTAISGDRDSSLEMVCKNTAVLLSVDIHPDGVTHRRKLITRNHSATHLLHHTLRLILGNHIEQKGSYVGPDYFRFDFSHYEKLNPIQLLETENQINDLIIKGIELKEFRELPIQAAKEMGALALFGEKYDNKVRVIQFGDSIELCGGTHVSNTAEIGLFKIISESSVASGVRRIEAVTSGSAIELFNTKLKHLDEIALLLKKSDNITMSVKQLIHENKQLNELAQDMKNEKGKVVLNELVNNILIINEKKMILKELDVDVATMKNICFSLINKYDDLCVVLAIRNEKKIILNIALSKNLVKETSLNASSMINQVSTHINGKGGGQAFFAVASGDVTKGIQKVFDNVQQIITSC